MNRGNLHTHTIYCDGKDCPEEIVKTAIKKGFSYIGFSGHSPMGFETDYAMDDAREERYFDEITAIRDKYRGKIKILCGIEKDFFSPLDTKKYDYTIASVHYVRAGDKYFDVDLSAQAQKETIEKYFGGDPYSYAEQYYSFVSQLSGDVVGHFDLLTKFDENNTVFTPVEERYKKAVLSALEALLEKNSVFEVNTGAMARGYKNMPYPDIWILEEIKKRDGRVLLTSDCHDVQNLDYGYDMAEKLLHKIGFKDIYNIDFTDIEKGR